MSLLSSSLGLWLIIGLLLMMVQGCALQVENSAKSLSSSGLIATPASQYSTPRGRYLGQRYKDNLERMVEKIVRNPRTAKLQFANNIASVGGIGFFTHSSVAVPDDRFLEVVLGTAETFAEKGDHSTKIGRIFSLYGRELLAILSSDIEILGDKELAGYGLNFTWRTLNPTADGSRVGTERAIAYFPKERVRAFLKDTLSENRLLSDAVIFAVQENGPMNLVSFRAPEQQPDFRPPIQEQVLLPAPVKTEPETKPVTPLMPVQPPKETEKLEAIVKEESTGEIEQAAITQKEAVRKVKPFVKVQPALEPAPAPQQITENADSQVRAEEKTTDVSTAMPSIQPVLKETSPAKREKLRPLVRDDSPVGNDKAAATQTEVVEKFDDAAELSVGATAADAPGPAAQQVAELSELQVPLREQMNDSAIVEEPQSIPPNLEKTGAFEDVPVLSMGDAGADHTVVAAQKDIPADVGIPTIASITQTPVRHDLLGQSGSLPSGLNQKGEISSVTPLPSSASTVTALPPLDFKEPEPSPERVAPAPTTPSMEQAPQDDPIVEKPFVIVSAAEKTQPSPKLVDVPLPLPPSAPSMSHVAGTPANEQLVLLRERPTDEAVMNRPLVRPLPKSLEGFVIQVAFSDRSEAQRWADNFGQRGYAVSVTEAGAAGALRLRIGNFRVRDDAERQLRSLKQEGLIGIILNLPQVYRPEVRSSLP